MSFHVMRTLYVAAAVGGWISTSNQESEVVDLELDETEDISQDKSIGPESPSTPLAPSKSQTKT